MKYLTFQNIILFIIGSWVLLEWTTPSMEEVLGRAAQNESVKQEIHFISGLLPAFCEDDGQLLRELIKKDKNINNEALAKNGFNVLNRLKKNLEYSKPSSLSQKKIIERLIINLEIIIENSNRDRLDIEVFHEEMKSFFTFVEKESGIGGHYISLISKATNEINLNFFQTIP